jgi:hypothetical protein
MYSIVIIKQHPVAFSELADYNLTTEKQTTTLFLKLDFWYT